MWTTLAVQWNAYVQSGMHIYSGAYANNVNCGIAQFLFTLFIAVGSYEAYILT